MKKAAKKFGILVLIFFILSQIAVNTMPFSWGNTRLNTKYTQYKKEYTQYNTVFVGASTAYRHIDPKQFDAYVNSVDPGLHIRSYNFGIPANRTPQSVYLFENLMKFNEDNIKYIILDLSELTKMGLDNLHKKEMIYWYTWGNIAGVLKATAESEKGIGNKISIPALHAISFAEKSLMIGMGTVLVEQHAGVNLEPSCVGPEKNGFYSLNQEMKDEPEGDLARRYNILRTQDTIDARTKECQKLYDNHHDDSTNANRTVEKQLYEVIDYCKKHDIKIVFMLSQRLGERYKYLIPLYNALPEENKISFANPSAYPMFNERENLFDHAHLNETGAGIFTKIIADVFLEKIKLQEQSAHSTTGKKNTHDEAL